MILQNDTLHLISQTLKNANHPWALTNRSCYLHKDDERMILPCITGNAAHMRISFYAKPYSAGIDYILSCTYYLTYMGLCLSLIKKSKKFQIWTKKKCHSKLCYHRNINYREQSTLRPFCCHITLSLRSFSLPGSLSYNTEKKNTQCNCAP